MNPETRKLILELHGEGHSLTGITQELRARNIPTTGGEWWPSTIKATLHINQLDQSSLD